MLRVVAVRSQRWGALVAIAASVGAIAIPARAAPVGPDAGPSMNSKTATAPVPAAAPRELLLLVNSTTLRTHPLGSRAGALVAALPFWRRTFGGSDLQPVRDTDWVSLASESLRDPERETTLVRFAISDAEIDKAIAKITRTSKHGYVRMPPRSLAVVPPSELRISEQTMRTGKPSFKPTELFRVALAKPGMHFPALALAKPLRDLRVSVRSAPEGGADADLESDCDDATAAQEAADAINGLVRRYAFWGNLLTGGLLRGMHAVAERDHVKMHVTATRAQLDAVIDLVGPSLGAAPPPRAPSPAGSSSSAPTSSASKPKSSAPRSSTADAGTR